VPSIASSMLRSVRASCADLMAHRAAGFVGILLMGVGVGLSAASPPHQAHSLDEPTETNDQEAWGVVLRQISPPDVEEAPDEEMIGTPPPVGRFLQEGDDLRVPEDGRLLVLLRDGRTQEFTGGATPPDVESGEVDPLFRLLRALLRDEGSGSDAGADETDPGVASETPELAAPIRPIGGRMVRSLTPTLVWRKEAEASEYRVHLWSPDGSVVTLTTGPDSIWTVPSDRALSPGTVYEWAVEPLPGERVGVRSRFQVASREVLDGVAAELGQLRSRGLEPEEDGLLIAAALFRSMGLPYDALDALSDLEAHGDGWSQELHAFRERLVVELERPETADESEDDAGS
jgi:hypothetical protein